jgi:hypothetical protein
MAVSLLVFMMFFTLTNDARNPEAYSGFIKNRLIADVIVVITDID